MTNKEEVTEGEIVAEKKTTVRVGRRTRDNRLWFGLILMLIGVMFIVKNVFNLDVWAYFWPMLFVLLGLFLVANSFKK